VIDECVYHVSSLVQYPFGLSQAASDYGSELASDVVVCIVVRTVKDHFAQLERLQLTAAPLQLIDERPNAL
jgi:hypothetical protein